jgi:sigma-54 dependent transcriptional regulator, acetoin dehydrogenase operon transcriptional activator AcoR
MDENKIRHLMLDNISEGIIYADREERIRMINKKAKEIFGILYRHDIGHDEGSISDGDIIIIGDNSLGFDDGGMEFEDLKLLRIEEKLPPKAAFVYIGRYKQGGEYRYFENRNPDSLSITRKISGTELKSEINFIEKEIIIRVDDLLFPYKFVKGIGHMVILDKDSHRVKFYQSKGYSIRKEDLKTILNGGRFLKKIPETEMEYEVLNEKIVDVLGESESINKLLRSVRGESFDYKNKYDEINGRPVRCSIYSINNSEKSEGAFLKVEDLSEISKLLREKDEILRKLHEVQDKIDDPFSALIGESKSIEQVISYAKKASLSFSTILLQGESGTGKSLIARAIHDYSGRKAERFVEINCGAISENLLESELFGYIEGAFTGAKKEGKKGLVEYADKGTVFLDEISEMPLNLQVKLLHVIQNKKVIPVGGTKPVEVDIRFVCASNKDLRKMVEEGKFREDLYYRINVMPITMPSLRDRKEDLHLLIQSIIHRICQKNNKSFKIITNEAFNKLYSYNFPGNIRELENILERAINVVEDELITDDEIILNNYNNNNRVEDSRTLKDILETTERKVIMSYLNRFNGDKQRTMDALGIKKTAFYEKLKKYDIN